MLSRKLTTGERRSRSAFAQEQPERNFKFTTVDLKLLDEGNEVDRQLAKKGPVFSDAELTAYVQDVAERMLGGTTAPENIAYRVRVLRILW